MSGIKQKRVLEEGLKLANCGYIGKDRKNGKTFYSKDPFIARYKDRILSLAETPEKIKKIPTKNNLNVFVRPIGKFIKSVKVRYVSIDDIDSFKKVRNVLPTRLRVVKESKMKKILMKILKKTYNQKDWGGESNDIFGIINLNGKSARVAFALKGKATKGKLTPAKMGKNADQIQRLFKSPADVFMIQYSGDIDQSVISQMESLAYHKSYAEGRPIYFGVIDGDATSRILRVYS